MRTMNRIKTFCTLLPGLLTSINAYAGVTDGDVTAYRYEPSHAYVVFTDEPSDSPTSSSGPLGIAGLEAKTCLAALVGGAGVSSQLCSGTFGDPVETYTCQVSGLGSPNPTNTTWCLFSENPRTGGKAWAVKYVNGLIPTNDGASIVRCEGTDVFHADYGCDAALPSQISIDGGYMQVDTTDGNTPFGGDCAETAHNGRMVIDDVNNLLYICTANGWISK